MPEATMATEALACLIVLNGIFHQIFISAILDGECGDIKPGVSLRTAYGLAAFSTRGIELPMYPHATPENHASPWITELLLPATHRAPANERDR